MTDYTEFFLKTSSAVKPIYLHEISHPNFTQTYYIVSNIKAGITVTLEDSSSQAFVYYPLKTTGVGTNETLDQSIEYQLGDLGTILPTELDAIATADGFQTKPTVKYRIYRSDDLTAPLFGPLILEITNLTSTREGSAFTAAAPKTNIVGTGEIYSLDRFPMLKGFL